MRMLIQRVKTASVRVDDEVVGKIDKGLLVFLGIHKDDQVSQISWMINKLLNLRIFADELGKMNKSVQEIGGEVLVVSQFTLYGNCSGGRRPDFLQSAPPSISEPIYNQFIKEIRLNLGKVEAGIFGALMEVELVNDGPVTFFVES